MATIDFLVKRHGKKQKIEGIVPSTPADKEVLLSDEGAQEQMDFGREHIKPFPHYARVIGITSNYRRTRQTLELNLFAAGYNPQDNHLVTRVERSDIGLAAFNYAPDAHPDMRRPEILTSFAKTLLAKFWHPRQGNNPPCMAAYAAATLDAVRYSIGCAEQMPLKREDCVLALIVTHPTIIDALAYVFTDGRSAERAFGEGEFFTGRTEIGGDGAGSMQWSIHNEKFRFGNPSDKSIHSYLDSRIRGLASDARLRVPHA